MSKLALILVITLAAMGQTTVDLSGVWERNREASSPEKQPVDSMKVKIEQRGTTFDVTMRVVVKGALEQFTNRYIAAQETKGEMHGAPMTSRTEWDGKVLVVRSVARIVNKEL